MRPLYNEATRIVALATWNKVRQGQTCTLSGCALDALDDHFMVTPGPDADAYFDGMVAEPNPNCIGPADAYVISLSRTQREILLARTARQAAPPSSGKAQMTAPAP